MISKIDRTDKPPVRLVSGKGEAIKWPVLWVKGLCYPLTGSKVTGTRDRINNRWSEQRNSTYQNVQKKISEENLKTKGSEKSKEARVKSYIMAVIQKPSPWRPLPRAGSRWGWGVRAGHRPKGAGLDRVVECRCVCPGYIWLTWWLCRNRPLLSLKQS